MKTEIVEFTHENITKYNIADRTGISEEELTRLVDVDIAADTVSMIEIPVFEEVEDAEDVSGPEDS